MVEDGGGVEEHGEDDGGAIVLQDERRNGLQLGVHIACGSSGTTRCTGRPQVHVRDDEVRRLDVGDPQIAHLVHGKVAVGVRRRWVRVKHHKHAVRKQPVGEKAADGLLLVAVVEQDEDKAPRPQLEKVVKEEQAILSAR